MSYGVQKQLIKIAKILERMAPPEESRFDKSVAANRRISAAVEWIDKTTKRMADNANFFSENVTENETYNRLKIVRQILLSKDGKI